MLTHLFIQRPNEYLSVENIVNVLVREYPEYRDTNLKTFTGRLTEVLSHFERQGYVGRKKFSFHFQSEITLSDEQREAIVSFVDLIDKLRNGDRGTTEEGRRFAQSALNDPQLFSQLMLKAKEASPTANRANKRDMHSCLISILHENPNSTVKQILKILEERHGKKYTTPTTVRGFLSEIVKIGEILSWKTKSGNVYRVAEPDVQADLPQN